MPKEAFVLDAGEPSMHAGIRQSGAVQQGEAFLAEFGLSLRRQLVHSMNLPALREAKIGMLHCGINAHLLRSWIASIGVCGCVRFQPARASSASLPGSSDSQCACRANTCSVQDRRMATRDRVKNHSRGGACDPQPLQVDADAFGFVAFGAEAPRARQRGASFSEMGVARRPMPHVGR